MHRNNSKSKSLALGGILSAITVLCVYFASILPTSKLSLYVLSSFAVSLLIIELGNKTAWTFYATTSALIFIIVPDKLAAVPYITFFGAYGIIKHYIERRSSIIVDYVIKFIFFNINLALALFLMRTFFISDELFNKYPILLVILVIQPVFLIYDYVYTLFIRYYFDRLKNILRL